MYVITINEQTMLPLFFFFFFLHVFFYSKKNKDTRLQGIASASHEYIMILEGDEEEETVVWLKGDVLIFAACVLV